MQILMSVCWFMYRSVNSWLSFLFTATSRILTCSLDKWQKKLLWDGNHPEILNSKFQVLSSHVPIPIIHHLCITSRPPTTLLPPQDVS